MSLNFGVWYSLFVSILHGDYGDHEKIYLRLVRKNIFCSFHQKEKFVYFDFPYDFSKNLSFHSQKENSSKD